MGGRNVYRVGYLQLVLQLVNRRIGKEWRCVKRTCFQVYLFSLPRRTLQWVPRCCVGCAGAGTEHGVHGPFGGCPRRRRHNARCAGGRRGWRRDVVVEGERRAACLFAGNREELLADLHHLCPSLLLLREVCQLGALLRQAHDLPLALDQRQRLLLERSAQRRQLVVRCVQAAGRFRLACCSQAVLLRQRRVAPPQVVELLRTQLLLNRRVRHSLPDAALDLVADAAEPQRHVGHHVGRQTNGAVAGDGNRLPDAAGGVLLNPDRLADAGQLLTGTFRQAHLVRGEDGEVVVVLHGLHLVDFALLLFSEVRALLHLSIAQPLLHLVDCECADAHAKEVRAVVRKAEHVAHSEHERRRACPRKRPQKVQDQNNPEALHNQRRYVAAGHIVPPVLAGLVAEERPDDEAPAAYPQDREDQDIRVQRDPPCAARHYVAHIKGANVKVSEPPEDPAVKEASLL
eukprot:Rhum_TRINITY_DN1442_c0_g1::Rhum_TRINITY_DN1442_c0_g1_i1::g.4204::m.4204